MLTHRAVNPSSGAGDLLCLWLLAQEIHYLESLTDVHNVWYVTAASAVFVASRAVFLDAAFCVRLLGAYRFIFLSRRRFLCPNRIKRIESQGTTKLWRVETSLWCLTIEFTLFCSSFPWHHLAPLFNIGVVLDGKQTTLSTLTHDNVEACRHSLRSVLRGKRVSRWQREACLHPNMSSLEKHG